MKIQDLYTPYKTIPIYKIILKNLNLLDKESQNYKLIFIGPIKDIKIRNHLQKIEKGLELNTKENKELKEFIPYYQKIFDIDNKTNDNILSNEESDEFQIKFIYHHLETNTPVSHLQFIIYDLLKDDKLGLGFSEQDYHPDNQLIYKYSANMSFKYYVKIMNSIFKDEISLERENFISNLQNILKISKDELINYFKTINPKSLFILQNEFNYVDVINSVDLLKLFLKLPQFLNLKYTYQDNKDSHLYLEFNNIERVIQNSLKSTKKNLVLNQNLSLLPYQEIGFRNLNSFDKFKNNNIYVLFKKSCQPVLTENLINFYFPSDRLKYKLDSSYLNQYRHLFNSSVNSIKNEEPSFKVQNMLNKYLIIELYTPEINNQLNLNLTDIFNLINTNYYMPIVKLVDNDSIHKFKIFKSFLQKHELSEISSLVEIRSHQKMKLNTNVKKYLQIKWRITPKFILTINIYESGYMIAFFEEDNYIDISVNIIPFSSLINSTIRMIKKYLSLKHLSIPNVEQIFYETSNKIYYNSIVNCNIIINSLLDIPNFIKEKQYQVKDLFKYIKKELKHYPQFIVDESTHNYLRLCYKQVDNFYSLENIMQRINSFYSKKKDKVTKTEKENLIKYIQMNFYLDKKFIEELIEKRDNYELTSTHAFLFGVEVNIKVDYDGNLTITLDNIDSFYTIRKIVFYLESVLNHIKQLNNKEDITADKFIKESGIIHSDQDLIIDDKTTKKKGSKSKGKSIRNSELDLNLDTNLGLDLDLDLDLDLNIDLDLDLDLDILDMENTEAFDLGQENEIKSLKDLEKDKGSSILDNDLVGAKIKKYDLGDKKLKFKEYMKQMRKLYDPELYEVKGESGNVIYSYGTDCDNKQMRQPMIVSKQDIDSYEKGSITGYMKYRNNYYICPRIWDYKANAPISVDKFIKNGLKSPYSQGKPIPTDKRDKVHLDDENTIIIRKGTTDTYWQDNEIHKDWPDILKGTEKDAYPGLTSSKKHPKKLCVPCCFKKPSKDFDPTIEEIQRILRPNGFDNCKGNFLQEDFDDIKDKKIVSKSKDSQDKSQNVEKKLIGHIVTNINNVNCKDQVSMYISNQTADLEKCKFGLLPNNLDLYFNNHQELFLHKNEYNLVENTNVLLRRGVDNNKRNNFLETMSVIYDRSYDNFINKLKDSISPELFITLNNGELISIYANQNAIPETEDDFNKFKLFIYKYQNLGQIFDFDIEILQKMELNQIYNLKTRLDSNKNIHELSQENLSIKKMILLYKIYSSFYNFIAHILDPFEYKNYTHFLDLFTKPLTFLKSNDTYKNILIFTEDNLIECLPYNNIKRNNAIILIKKSNYHFIPIFNVILPIKEKVLKSMGIINLNNINLSDEYYKYHKDKKKNIKLLDDTKLRKNKIGTTIFTILHACTKNNNSTYFETILRYLSILNSDVKHQVINNNPLVEYIILENDILLPIFPTNIKIDNEINIDEGKIKINVKFGSVKIINSEMLKPLDKYFKLFDLKINLKDKEKIKKSNLLKKIIEDNYSITKILYNVVKKKIIGIKFKNNLLVPVIEESLDRNKLINLFKSNLSLSKFTNDDLSEYIDNVLYDFNIQINNENTNITNKNVIMNDLLYHQFKFEFSKKINEILIIKQKIRENLFEINKKEVHKRDELIYNLQNVIYKFMKKFVHDGKIRNDLKTGFKFVKCDKLSNRKCLKNPFCLNTKSKKKELKNEKITKNVKLSRKRSSIKNSESENRNSVTSSIEDIKDSILDIDDSSSLDDKIYKNLIKKQDKIEKINDEFFNNLEPIIKKYQKDCKFVLNNKLLIYFSYLLSLDLISNKLQSRNIIDGNYVPKFINLLSIFNNDKQLVTNLKELTYILEHNLESKNKNKIILNYKKLVEKIYFPSNEDINWFNEGGKEYFDKEKDIKDKDSNIYTTVFNKDGEYNKEMENAKCLFPFLTKKGNLIDKCIYSVDGSGLKCPTKLDSYRNPIKWGYCPEKQSITKERLNIEEINTIGYQKEYMVGKCQFPYLDLDSKKVKLFTDCQLDKKKKLTWCPTELNYDKESLLMAASSIEDIYNKKWDNTNIMLGSKINPKYQTKKRGICKTAEDLNDIKLINDNEEITFNNYQLNKCTFPQKKGGYTKLQLFNFGVNVLEIPYTELKSGDTIIHKDKLCNKINEVYRKKELGTKQITDYERANSYQKKLGKCLEGENKGGYYKSELREMGIKYFDLDEESSQNMSKKDLCEYIIPKVIEVRKKLGVSIESSVSSTKLSSISKKDLDKLYPGKIDKCNESPQRGGINIKKLKKIATENFGIDIGDMQKTEICNAIENKMKEIYNQLIDPEEDKDTKESILDLKEVDKLLDL